MRQTYGIQLMTLMDEIYREKNERTYGLTRAANAGAVSYPYVIYNDYYSHKDFITALINSSFCGILWTPEVRQSGTGEEWLRRMQTVCFSPLAMINAWSAGTKPWSFPDVYEACQKVAFLRMQLLPYIYSTFAQYYFEGKPPFRALELLEGYVAEVIELEGKLDDEKNPYAEAITREIKNQYLMGDYIMVAPLFEGEKEREVVLPKGNWYDFYNGDYVGNGEVIHVKPETMDIIPLFVKDGGILPMIEPIRQTSECKDLPLEVRVYGKADGCFVLYDDDGITFDYENGRYTQKALIVRSGKGKVEQLKSDGGWSYGKITWNFMTT